MNRRAFLAGIAGVAGGLILPPSVGDVAAEVERRYWALGAINDAVTRSAMYSATFAGEGMWWHQGMYVKVPSSPTTFTITLPGPRSYFVGDHARLFNLESRTYEDFVVLAVEEHAKDFDPMSRAFGA